MRDFDYKCALCGSPELRCGNGHVYIPTGSDITSTGILGMAEEVTHLEDERDRYREVLELVEGLADAFARWRTSAEQRVSTPDEVSLSGVEVYVCIAQEGGIVDQVEVVSLQSEASGVVAAWERDGEHLAEDGWSFITWKKHIG